MLENRSEKHRARIKNILSEDVFAHQRRAAKNTFNALGPDCRTVIMAAEMQSGKSGIALALACMQRNSLSDQDIVDQNKLTDTLYVLTMPNTDLLAQAKSDLKPCYNVVVTNLNHFQKDIDKGFQSQRPKLIIIDECHYGSGEKAVRYETLFDYIEKSNLDCRVVFISATPLSALIAAEDEAILRKNLKTKLVFHKASEEYLGIAEMIRGGQVIGLNGRSRNIMNHSVQREHFISHVKDSENPGWALIRVPAGAPMEAKKILKKQGFEEDNIFILGKNLNGVPENEQIDVDQFKIEYEQGMLFDKKMIAITVAGVRAGINFGQSMKENLLASWDSTVSSVAAIVQANIGRACGYHANKSALHFANKSGVQAYSDVVSYLEMNCTSHATDDLEGLREEFERICTNYDVKGLDAGARVRKGNKKKIGESLSKYKAYHTDSYLIVPAHLHDDFDFSIYTEDPAYLESIGIVRKTLLKGGLQVKSSRSLPAGSNSIASWVNGDTYSNSEKASKRGPISEQVANITTLLDLNSDIKFNDVILGGGGVDVEKFEVGVFVFSIYNESRRKEVSNRVMTIEQVHEVANAYGVAEDDTILVMFKKGEYSQALTDEFINQKIAISEKSPIVEESKFQRIYS